MRAALVISLVLLVTGDLGCKRGASNAAAAADAAAGDASAASGASGATAGAADAAGDAASGKSGSKDRDRTFRVVAQAPMPNLTLTALGARIVLSAGPLLYDAKEDGELSLVGGPDAYAPLYPDDESLIGYSPVIPTVTGLAAEPDGALLLQLLSPERKTWRAAAGTAKLAVADAKPFFRAVPFRGKMLGVRRDPVEIAWLDGSKGPLPSGLTGQAVQDLALTKSGALVVLTLAQKDRSFHAFVHRADAAADEAPADTKLATDASPSCDFVPSFDGATYVRCASFAKEKRRRTTNVLRLDGTEWKPSFADASFDQSEGPMSIDRDGTLWAAGLTGSQITRCPTSGKCAPFEQDLAKSATRDARASFVRAPTDTMDQDGVKYWESISLMSGDFMMKGAPSISRLLVRAPDDAWIVLSGGGQTELVVHSGGPRDVVHLPSDIDARLVVRNARPPQQWIGRCDHVFVRMAGARGDKALDLEAAKARLADIKTTLAAPPGDDDYGAPFAWALVEGTLFDERVVGVVVHRTDVGAPVERMEKAVEKLVEKLATNPVTKPLVTCTLPVLKTKLSN